MQVLARKPNSTDLTDGPILKSLIAFAVPIVMTNLIQQLYGMVDLMVIGQYVGNAGSIGVNTGGEIVDIIYPVAMGFGSAGQIFISQLYGAKEYDRVKRTISTLITFMLLLSALFMSVTIILKPFFLNLLNCPEEGYSEAARYMFITALGIPFIFGYNAVCSILRGMGESTRPLLFIIIAAVINIFLDILLVAVIPLGAAGTAIATIASEFGSFLAALIYLNRNKEKFGFEFKMKCLSVDRKVLKILVELAIPQIVRSFLVRVSMLWVNATANSYGAIVSTTNGIGNKLEKFLDVFRMGIDTASGAMIGQNLGAKKHDRAEKVTNYTLYISLACAGIVTLLIITIPEQMFGVFTNDKEVIGLGVIFLRIMIMHFVVSAVVGSYQAMVTGSGFVKLGFAIGILDGVICKVGLSALFVYVFNMGYLGLFWGVACSRILPAIICAVYFYSGRWRTRKLLSEK